MQHKGTARLVTKRLELRRFTADDAPVMFSAWASDPEVTTYLTWTPHTDVDQTRAVIDSWIACYDDPSFYQWAIVLRETGKPIGSISVVRWSHEDCCPEIGYCIERRRWHHALTTEALTAVIDFLFGEVGAERISAKHDVENPFSGRVMRHAGMSYVGTERRSSRNNRGLVDVDVYDIIRSDWEAARHARALMESHAVQHPKGDKTRAASAATAMRILRHEDINGTNRLFGGRLMEWIDDIAGTAAIRHCGMTVTTACVDALEFRAPAFLGDIVTIEAEVTFVGKSSLEVRANSYVENASEGTRTLINRAFFTEVCVDGEGRPCTVPYGLALTRAEEFEEWEQALFRKEMREARRESGV